MAKIGVYIPTSGRPDLLMRSVASVRAQAFSDWSCIIVIDGSDPTSAQFLDNLCSLDKRFKFFTTGCKKGAPYARNLAITNLDCEYVTGLDDDDMFLPGRLQRLYDYKNHSESLISSNDLIISGNKAFKTRRRKRSSISDITFRNSVGNQALISRDRIEKVGLYDVKLPAMQDQDLWIRLISAYGPSYCIRDINQIIFSEQSRKRITTDSNRVISADMLLEKHNSIMSEGARRATKSRKCLMMGVKPSLIDFMAGFEISLDFARECKNLFDVLMSSKNK